MSRISSEYPMVSFSDAISLVKSHIASLSPIKVPLHESIGMISANDIVSNVNLPNVERSEKDGFAVIWDDVEKNQKIKIVAKIHANKKKEDIVPSELVIVPGTCSYIATGGVIPIGADSVVMIEDVVMNEGEIVVERKTRKGADVKRVGSDVKLGERVVGKGKRMTPGEIALCASVGMREIEVIQRPNVVVMSTGDELVDLNAGNDGEMGHGIVDSNRPMLCAALKNLCGTVHDFGIAPDSLEELSEMMHRAFELADVVITSGGVSMGERDFVKMFLAQSAEVHFGRVQMKPGKPITFATIPFKSRKIKIFGLPGNPVSSLVGFHLFVRPALHWLAGESGSAQQIVQARLTKAVKIDTERKEFMRVMLVWNFEKHCYDTEFLAGSQASSRLLSISGASLAFLDLPLQAPDGGAQLEAGSFVDAIVLPSYYQ